MKKRTSLTIIFCTCLLLAVSHLQAESLENQPVKPKKKLNIVKGTMKVGLQFDEPAAAQANKLTGKTETLVDLHPKPINMDEYDVNPADLGTLGPEVDAFGNKRRWNAFIPEK